MRRALGLLLLAISALTGCAAHTAQPSTPASAPPSASTPPSAVGSPSSTRSPAPAGSVLTTLPSGVPKPTGIQPPTDDFTALTATGKVKITPGCVQLVTSTITWTLIGPKTTGLRDGQQATVTGLPDPTAESTCPGSPLRVNTIT